MKFMVHHAMAGSACEDGVKLAVTEQLGHSSIQMTVDVYGHLIPSNNRGAVNQLDSQQPSATYTQPAKIRKL
jgi:integrase